LTNFTMLACPAALPGSFARQPCPTALSCSLVRQLCPAALPGSLARQPCLAALPGRIYRLYYGRMPACSITYFYRLKTGSLVQAFTAIIKTLRLGE
jgi:hypothetical protein